MSRRHCIYITAACGLIDTVFCTILFYTGRPVAAILTAVSALFLALAIAIIIKPTDLQ